MTLAAVQLPPRSISVGCPTTVLLVEPERPVRVLLARILAESGYEVVRAGGGIEALELLRSRGAGVDVVLTEVVLPSSSGAKLAAEIRHDYPGTAVLYMTGWFDDVVERHGIVESRVEMLRKPFGPDDLRRRLSEVVDAQRRWHGSRIAA